MSDQPLALVNADHQTALSIPDTDNPHLGLIGGVCIWLLSFSLPQVVPLPYLLIARNAGKVVIPTPDDLLTGNLDVRFIIISLVSTLIIHIIMLAACWAVVTQFGRLPFFATLGWHWAGMPVWMRILLVVGVMGTVIMIQNFLPRVLPDTQINTLRAHSAGVTGREVSGSRRGSADCALRRRADLSGDVLLGAEEPSSRIGFYPCGYTGLRYRPHSTVLGGLVIPHRAD